MKKALNPFLTKGYRGPKYFCDRDKETETIIEGMENGRNITIYGRRKLGKTALIKHVFDILKDDFICIWVDLLPTQSFDDMINQLANNIYIAFENNKSLKKKFFDGFKALRPIISYDEISGIPQVTLDNSNKTNLKNSFENLISLLKLFNKPVIIALDEFQQILNYPEEDTEAYLRTIMQELSDTQFIFSGSDQHMLTQMFTRYDKPFYQMSQLLKLRPIENDVYKEFILQHFVNGKKSIDTEGLELIMSFTAGVTYFTQVLCNRIYSQKSRKIDNKIIWNVINSMFNELEDHYFTFRNILTTMQWRVLKAIAKEGVVKNLYAKSFMKKHGFYNASSIKKTIESLEKDQLIYKSIIDNEKQYAIQDVFFSQWLSRL